MHRFSGKAFSGPFFYPDLAMLLLRFTCGGLLLLHGSHTLFRGLSHVKRMVADAGLPAFIAYGNIVGEVVAPVFLILGYRTRIAALVIAVNMLMSVAIAHRDIAFSRNDFGGWMIELNVFYFMTAVVIFFAGAGKFRVGAGRGWLE